MILQTPWRMIVQVGNKSHEKIIRYFVFDTNFFLFFKGSDCLKKWTNMRDAYMKAKNKKLGSGSAARKSPRDESMSFLSEIKTTNTRFAILLNKRFGRFSNFLNENKPYHLISDFSVQHQILFKKRCVEKMMMKKKTRHPKKKISTQLEDFSKVMQKNQEKKLDLLEKIIQKSPEKTDLDLFFIAISKTVKKFTPKDQALLKM